MDFFVSNANISFSVKLPHPTQPDHHAHAHPAHPAQLAHTAQPAHPTMGHGYQISRIFGYFSKNDTLLKILANQHVKHCRRRFIRTFPSCLGTAWYDIIALYIDERLFFKTPFACRWAASTTTCLAWCSSTSSCPTRRTPSSPSSTTASRYGTSMTRGAIQYT